MANEPIADPRPERRSLDLVFHPERHPPFQGIEGPDGFRREWDRHRVRMLAELSHAAYFDEPELRRLLEPFEPRRLEPYDEGGAQAFLAVWPEHAVLAFRGSEPRERRPLPEFLRRGLRRLAGIELPEAYESFLASDVLADIAFRTHPLGDVRVHRGFLAALRKLWEPRVLPDLKALPAGLPVSATGHSLGGAMATVAGLFWNFEEVVTFGEPRVGRRVGSKFRPRRHLRVVNGLDPVVNLPPDGFPFFYEHHGEVLEIVDPVGPNALFDHSLVLYARILAATPPAG